MTKKIVLGAGEQRSLGTMVLHELWDYYLPFIGGNGALLYCYLLRLVQKDKPISYEDIAADLSWDYASLQEALVILVEYDLVGLGVGDRLMINHPKNKEGLAMLLEDRTTKGKKKAPVVADIAGVRKAAIVTTLRRNQESKTIYSIVEQEFGRPLRPSEFDLLAKIEEDYARELIIEAVYRAVVHQAYNVQYIESILYNWNAKGIQTLADVQKDDERFKKMKNKKYNRKVSNLSTDHPSQTATTEGESSNRYRALYKKFKDMQTQEG